MHEAAFEVARVARHIEGAEQVAKAAPPRGLDRLRLVVRALLLEELEEYRRRGAFPKNRDFRDRPRPYFIDADGTRCAMAHLLEVGGASALVARIAAERNNAFVRELADEPELLAWLDAAGLTVDEAARIQPSYCDTNASMVCGGVFTTKIPPSATGVLELRIILGPDAKGHSKARVENVFGEGGRFAVGDELLVNGHAVGSVFLAPLYGGPDGGADADASPVDAGADQPLFFFGVELHPGGIVKGQYGGSNDGHPLTSLQIADAYRSPNCQASLVALDAWWAQSTCTGQQPTEPGNEQTDGAVKGPGSSGATSSSGASGPPAADPSPSNGGCSTTTADGSAATVQVLLAVVAAVCARRLARTARRS